MDKNIFHLVGMPRAGNTLLGGIINQNPNLQVSPLSPLSRTVSVYINHLREKLGKILIGLKSKIH